MWQLSVVHLATRFITDIVFQFSSSKNLVFTLKEDIITQLGTEKQDKNQISEKKFKILSDFELKILQRVRF